MFSKVLPIACLLFGAATACLAETVVEVRPDGAVNSLVAARDKVREIRKAGERGAVRVVFLAGRYAITEPVVFSMEDGGTPTGPTTYEAAANAEVWMTGGRTITGWQPGADGVWKTTIEDVKAGQWLFEQLWVNGHRATRARTPNVGFLSMYSQAGADTIPNMKDPNFQAFVVRPPDMKLLQGIPAAELPDVLLTVTHAWAVGQCRIEALNGDASAVKIKGRSRYPFVEFEPDQRYFVENFRSALDEAGEWFLARDGTLYYKPLPGEDMSKAEVTAPVAESLLRVEGDPDKEAFVEHLTFKGLKFAHTQFLFGPDGYHDGQAASGVHSAIELNGARHVNFENCEIAHVGGYGVFFRQFCSESAVRHCYLHDLGGGGARIGDVKMPKNNVELVQRITVDDCIIHSGGRMVPSACGVFLAHAADCQVTHNDIGDLYYTGISAGWVWGYRPSPSKRNRFDYNHIHHLGQGYLSDMGGFYGLGRAEGTTVSHNHVHHVASYRYGGWGLYTDEGSTGVTMEFNLVHDTSEGTFHQHYGKWNQISNNIFAFGKVAQIQRSRPETHTSFAYENNIVIYETPTLLHGSWYNWEPGTLEMRNNLYWNTAGLPVKFIDTDLAGWQKKTGRDEGSMVADPLFVDAANRDFRLKPESPALKKLGFKMFDWNEAGVRGDANSAWRKLSLSLSFPNWDRDTLPWPKPEYAVDTDFEHMGLSFPTIPRQEINWENKGDSIFVSEEQALSGRRSLRFVDAPGLERAWNPHLVLKPDFKQGDIVRGSFALRMEPGALLDHEWRSQGHPYAVGPSFSVRGGKLQIRNGPSVDLPVSQWATFDIESKVGSGIWKMTVTVKGQAPRVFDSLTCQKEWQDLSWIGWTSVAKEKTVFYLDDLHLHRLP